MNATYGRIFNRGRVCFGHQKCRLYSSDVKSMYGIPQKTNHCSGLPPRTSYTLESRTLLIQQSLENLKSEKIKINKPGVEININDQYQSKGTGGASLFLYEKVPILKYHNPDVPITCTRFDNLPWYVKVKVEDGEWISVPIDGHGSEEILNELLTIIDTKIEEEVIG